MCEEEQSET